MHLDDVALQAPTALGLQVRNAYSYFDGVGGVHERDSATIDSAAMVPGRARSGSGGSYLSNEIYYRSSLIGARYGRAVPNVHLHVPYSATPAQVQQIIQLILEHGL